MKSRALIRGLYAVTPDSEDTDLLLGQVGAAIRGGASVVQYRNKTASHELKLRQAQGIRTLCARNGATFIVNDDVQMALEVEADGVHIGREDSALTIARAALGSAKIIGVSCYNSIDVAQEAEGAGADYVAFGGFFPSSVKPGVVKSSIELLTQAKRALHAPVVAIGGITPENAPQLIEAGADAVAVITALFASRDVTAEARRFTALFETDDAQH